MQRVYRSNDDSNRIVTRDASMATNVPVAPQETYNTTECYERQPILKTDNRSPPQKQESIETKFIPTANGHPDTTESISTRTVGEHRRMDTMPMVQAISSVHPNVSQTNGAGQRENTPVVRTAARIGDQFRADEGEEIQRLAKAELRDLINFAKNAGSMGPFSCLSLDCTTLRQKTYLSLNIFFRSLKFELRSLNLESIIINGRPSTATIKEAILKATERWFGDLFDCEVHPRMIYAGLLMDSPIELLRSVASSLDIPPVMCFSERICASLKVAIGLVGSQNPVLAQTISKLESIVRYFRKMSPTDGENSINEVVQRESVLKFVIPNAHRFGNFNSFLQDMLSIKLQLQETLNGELNSTNLGGELCKESAEEGVNDELTGLEDKEPSHNPSTVQYAGMNNSEDMKALSMADDALVRWIIEDEEDTFSGIGGNDDVEDDFLLSDEEWTIVEQLASLLQCFEPVLSMIKVGESGINADMITATKTFYEYLCQKDGEVNLLSGQTMQFVDCHSSIVRFRQLLLQQFKSRFLSEPSSLLEQLVIALHPIHLDELSLQLNVRELLEKIVFTLVAAREKLSTASHLCTQSIFEGGPIKSSEEAQTLLSQLNKLIDGCSVSSITESTANEGKDSPCV